VLLTGRERQAGEKGHVDLTEMCHSRSAVAAAAPPKGRSRTHTTEIHEHVEHQHHDHHSRSSRHLVGQIPRNVFLAVLDKFFPFKANSDMRALKRALACGPPCGTIGCGVWGCWQLPRTLPPPHIY
jgi:hypothetical protein